jgi:hypothetical protein
MFIQLVAGLMQGQALGRLYKGHSREQYKGEYRGQY